ncbi:hypothetical protein [Sulfurospirillum cavolei]|uniref:hypothetical protein n=1 Tax=Sulfurospirillum cavolei TaxID=366522 RepID=UPI003FA21E3D
MNVKVQITRPIFIDGETKQIGDTVEVENNFALELISVNAAERIEEKENGDELTELKAKADELGIKYTKKSTVEELTKLIEEAQSK